MLPICEEYAFLEELTDESLVGSFRVRAVPLNTLPVDEWGFPLRNPGSIFGGPYYVEIVQGVANG